MYSIAWDDTVLDLWSLFVAHEDKNQQLNYELTAKQKGWD